MLNLRKAYALAAALVLALAIALTPRAAAENDGKVLGTVIDFDGNPFAGITVKIKSEQGALQETKTDAQGKYQFVNLRSGKYTVSFIVAQIAQPFEQITEVHSGDVSTVNVNFKEILEKQNPDAAKKYKEQQAEQGKAAGVKQHFNAGADFLTQERLAKANLSKAPADQRDQVKASLKDLSDKAVNEFQEALKLTSEKDTNRAVIEAKIAEAYDTAGRNDEALEAYKQAIASKPDNPGLYLNMGNVLGRMGKIEEAKAAYLKSVELDPASAATAWRNFGITMYQANRPTDAIEPLKKSAELDPKSAQTWYLLGTCMVADPSIYKQVGDKIEVTPLPGTADAFEKAIQLDPNGPIGAQAKEGLAQLNQMTGGIDTKIGSSKKKKS